MQENNKNDQKDQLSDLIDSPKDREEMNQGITTINFRDVDKIHVSEKIVPFSTEENAGAPNSSEDEEKSIIFYKDINLEMDMEENPDSNVTPAEKENLDIAANDLPGDDENLRKAALDDTDNDGIPLNEGSFKNNVTSSDLDIPGADLDDENESIGEEDEENNDYSLGGDKDVIPEDEF